MFKSHYGSKSYCLALRKANVCWKGFTLLELSVALFIVAILVCLMVPAFQDYIYRVQVGQAIADIRMLEKRITIFFNGGDTHVYPASLADIHADEMTDPWGNPYQYTPIEGYNPKKVRKDRFLVPLSSDYDLYSSGKDGKSRMPLTAKASRDDIVRANNGQFVGLAYKY